MHQLNMKCGCDKPADIKVYVLIGAISPVAEIKCLNCGFSYISVGIEVSYA